MPEGQIRTPEIPNSVPPEIGPSGFETSAERPAPATESGAVTETPLVVPVPTVPVIAVTPAPSENHILEKQIEDILAEGLAETYKKLDPATQAKFKADGERTAATITVLLQATKIQVRKILELLIQWLRVIPGVNKFFLEQEAKIKADKILALRNQPPL